MQRAAYLYTKAWQTGAESSHLPFPFICVFFGKVSMRIHFSLIVSLTFPVSIPLNPLFFTCYEAEVEFLKMQASFFMPSAKVHRETFTIVLIDPLTKQQRKISRVAGGGGQGGRGQLVIDDSSRNACQRFASAPLPPHPQTTHHSVFGWW